MILSLPLYFCLYEYGTRFCLRYVLPVQSVLPRILHTDFAGKAVALTRNTCAKAAGKTGCTGK